MQNRFGFPECSGWVMSGLIHDTCKCVFETAPRRTVIQLIFPIPFHKTMYTNVSSYHKILFTVGQVMSLGKIFSLIFDRVVHVHSVPDILFWKCILEATLKGFHSVEISDSFSKTLHANVLSQDRLIVGQVMSLWNIFSVFRSPK